MGAHATKWTLKYKLVKWEGGPAEQDTKLFDTLNAAALYFDERKVKLSSVAPKGLYLHENTLTPPKTMKGKKKPRPQHGREVNKDFSKSNPNNPFGGKAKK